MGNRFCLLGHSSSQTPPPGHPPEGPGTCQAPFQEIAPQAQAILTSWKVLLLLQVLKVSSSPGFWLPTWEDIQVSFPSLHASKIHQETLEGSYTLLTGVCRSHHPLGSIPWSPAHQGLSLQLPDVGHAMVLTAFSACLIDPRGNGLAPNSPLLAAGFSISVVALLISLLSTFDASSSEFSSQCERHVCNELYSLV